MSWFPARRATRRGAVITMAPIFLTVS